MGKHYKEQHLLNLNVQDVEEGEHSDSGSLEEISEDAFNAMKKKQTLKSSINSRVTDSNNRSGSNRVGRVWTTRDVYKGSGNSYPEFYHLALTRAENKQRLDEAFVRNDTSNDNNGALKCSTENIIIVEDDDELEEGEIKMDVDMDDDMVIDMDIDSDVERDKDEFRRDSSVIDMTKQVDMIKEELESLNVDDGDISYDSLCSRLEKTADTLHAMIVKDGVPKKEALVQLVFTKILKLLSSHGLNEQNKDVLTRLTAHANRAPALFSYSQLKEIKIAMFSSWNKPADSSIDSIDNTRKQIIVEHANNDPTENPTNGEMEHVLTTVLSNQPEDRFPKENGKSGPSPQTSFLPLLELHNQPDADNLPSSTRASSVSLPCGKGFPSDCVVMEPERHVLLHGGGENIPMFSSRTNAVRAVSSGQQKLERSEFLTSERLPSRTPTEEGSIADGGVNGAVSSSIGQDNAVLNRSIPKQPLVSSASRRDLPTTQEETKSYEPSMEPASKSRKPAPKAKRRDRRIRLTKSGVAKRDINVNLSSRVSELSPEPHGDGGSMQKEKMADEDLSDSPAVKCPRNESTSSRDKCDLRAGGSLENIPMFPCETDAVRLRVVSSHQQKHERSKLLTSERLPSLTPTEEGDIADGGVGGEASNSIAQDTAALNSSIPEKSLGSTSDKDMLTTQEETRIHGPLMEPMEAVRAVSSDQQKLERSEFLTSKRLPSPTPTEVGDLAEGGVGGEASGSIGQDTAALNSSIPEQSLVSSALDKDMLTTQDETRIHGPLVEPMEAVRAVSSDQQKLEQSEFLTSKRLPSPNPTEVGDMAEGGVGEEVSSSIDRDTVALNSSIPEQLLVSSASDKNMSTTQEETRIRGPPMEPSEAARVVSSDQQKLERCEFLTSERLRSPTPTVEDGIADGGVGGEVSSSIIHDNAVVNGSIPKQSLVSSASDKDSLTTQEETRRHGPLMEPASISQKTAPKAKRRDPRLRLAKFGVAKRDINTNVSSRVSELSPESHGGVMSMQQAKMADEDLSDSPAVKRQRNESTSAGDSSYLRTGGSLGDNGTVEFNAALSLSSLLRDIVVNPSTWIDILKEEHAKSSKSIKCTSEVINSSSTGALFSSVNGVPPSSIFGQITTKETLKEDSVKVRMKPRDPRRKLYDGAVLKGMNTGSDHSASLVNLDATKEDGKLGSSSSPKLPDIAIQFTENLSRSSLIRKPSGGPQSVMIYAKNSGVLNHENLKNSSETASAEAVAAAPLRPINANAWSDFDQLLGAFDDEQKAFIQIERAKRLEEQKKMFAHRKLSLVLDLDHTLLNSAMFVDVNPQQDEILRKKEERDRQNPLRHLFCFPHMGMWTKLRPGIWNFLKKASKLYELHVYTMGNKSYATEMAKLLDPNGELFAGRVFSRGDDCEPFDKDDRFYKTKDLEGVLGLETNVVIIDDTIRVWPHNRPNLIVVERYMYFPCSRRQFGLQGPSLLEIDRDERPEDGTLASCLAVIERIHSNFFARKSLEEVDVRDILASEQQKILSGCRIVFSRVFRVGEANPHMHPLWKTAEQFGAVCTNCVDERVTHVVAISLGTNKVNWALSRGRYVVHPGWVEASALLYRRANEHDFSVR